MKHTKGKWELSHNTNQGIKIVISPDDPLKTENICSIFGSPSEESTYANAKLIAAAPELLEALLEAKIQIEYMHERTGETGTGVALLSRINTLISKINK